MFATNYRRSVRPWQRGSRKRAEAELRAERLDPINEAARHIWSQLRQESNVELRSIGLKGSSTRRSLDIQAMIDTEATSALSVMSQGELHALALAVLLPRATSEESPFRFIVLDDPVQAMDPAKVEGLAAVLDTIAKTRQVIVFSHDDRLAQAVRRLPNSARQLEVRRGVGSEVSLHDLTSPALSHLEDARALSLDDDVEVEVKRRVLPHALRLAIEAALWDGYASDGLGAGKTLVDIEQVWADNPRTRARLQLVLAEEPRDWLARDRSRQRSLVSEARAACWIARQALELTIVELLNAHGIDPVRGNARSRLICLQAFCSSDPAHRVQVSWWRLSKAAHHHAYELCPSMGEAQSLVAEVTEVRWAHRC